jgi:hypothetical protein
MHHWAVTVPTLHLTQHRRGQHIFTGPAASEQEAQQSARHAYDQGVAMQEAGLEIPSGPIWGWSARAIQPEWVLDWSHATVEPCSAGLL